MKSHHLSALIVGSGPVGMAIAGLMRKHGADLRIIEKNQEPTQHSKAIGIHASTLESMHALALTEQLISDGHPMHRFRVTEDERTILSAGFNNIDSPYGFVLGLPQSRTEHHLLNCFHTLGGEVEWGARLVSIEQTGNPDRPDQPAVVRIAHEDGREEQISCNWLIGADGSRSSVRELACIDFPGGDYGTAFILGDVKIDWDGPKYELQFFLSARGYLLLIPMPGGMHRVIAQTEKTYEDFQHGERPDATLEELQRIVDANGPGDIRVHSPQWLTCAPFYHRQAETSVKGRIVLAGDALHLFSPLGAQGLNTGFQDAFNLAWKLAFIEKGWTDANLIASYKSEREGIARRIAAVTARTTRYLTATSPPKRWLRQHLTRLLNRTERVQTRLPRLLSGVMQSYGPQSQLSGPCARGLPQAGSRLPHAWLPQGSALKPLASIVHGTQFTLLLVKNLLDDNSLAALERFWTVSNQARFPFLTPIVISRETAPWQNKMPVGCQLIDDRMGSMFNALNEYKEAMVLVRPDGFCSLSSKLWSFDEIALYFARRQLGAPTHANPVSSIQQGICNAA